VGEGNAQACAEAKLLRGSYWLQGMYFVTKIYSVTVFMLSTTLPQDLHVRSSVAAVNVEMSVGHRTELARTNRARKVRPVHVASSVDNSRSADVSDSLTSFFLLETPLPSLKGNVFTNSLVLFLSCS